MAVTLIATVGGSDSNSLGSVADADQYFTNLLSADQWLDLDPDVKKRSLITATADFEQVAWWGERVGETQALAWPRWYPLVSDGTTIPKEILAGFFEHALALGVAAEAASSGKSGSKWARLRAEGLTSYRLGDVSASFAAGGGAGSTETTLSQFSDRVQRLICRWVRTGFEVDSGRRPRGRRGTKWPWEY